MFDFLGFSTAIDFEGQKKAERCFQIICSVFAVLGFIIGYITQSFAYTLLCTGTGVVISSLVVLPPWPCWNKHPLKWQKPVGPDASEAKSKSESTPTPKKSDTKKSK